VFALMFFRPEVTDTSAVFEDRKEADSPSIQLSASDVRVRVLGPVEVITKPDGFVGSASVELAAKPLLLVALLASQIGHWVSTDSLVQELWWGAPISSATKTLHGNVLRARRVLGTSALLSKQGAYRLSAETSLDSTEFARQTDAIERSVDHQACDETIRKVLRAETLWRGDPFEGVDDTPMILEARQLLMTKRHRMREIRIGLLLHLGDAKSTVNELQQCVESDPYREAYWSLLIRALYLSARRSDALNVLRRAQHILSADLGVELGPNLRDLEAAIHQSDDAFIRSGSQFSVNLLSLSLWDVGNKIACDVHDQMSCSGAVVD
jgi:DNA-binding SARP family transcriptional activator